MDKGSGSLVVQVTSSPVSLGQEFSSQSPQVPQEAFRESVNLSGQQPSAVLTNAGDSPSCSEEVSVGSSSCRKYQDPAGPQKTCLGILFFGKLCMKSVLFLSAFKLHFCAFSCTHTCSRVCVYVCPGAHACCVCACGSQMSSSGALFLVFFEAGSH